MDAFLSGFADELVKVGSASERDKELRKALRAAKKGSYSSDSGESFLGRSGRHGRNYAGATALGAIASPLMFLAGRKAGRVLHNKGVMKALKSATPKQRKALKKQLQKGPTISSGIPKPRPGMEPLATTSELGSNVVRGALYGSVLQALKDRYGAKKK